MDDLNSDLHPTGVFGEGNTLGRDSPDIHDR